MEVSFPAAAERRTYAVDNAPLGRVRYAVGDRAETIDGLRFSISHCEERAGLMFYHGTGEDGATVLIPELELDCAVRFLGPVDRLFAGQIDRNVLFDLRAATLSYRHRHRASGVYGLLGPRVRLLPHQLYIAHEVARRHAPRVLLADEVGLGKTVEAGLIVHQQVLMGQARRVLVLLPDALIHQWLVEMLRRFSLHFTIIDGERCTALETSGSANPFEAAQLVLTPLSLLCGNEARLEQALAAGWDTLVVDEAHHLRWRPDAASEAYVALEQLAAAVPSVLLLTATPEQLGVEAHFARLRLLDPQRYYDLEAFVQAEQSYKPLSALVDRLLRLTHSSELDTAARAQAAELLGDDAVDALAAQADGEALRVAASSLAAQLLDRHGTGRVLFRNTRATVGGFPARVLMVHELPAYAQFTHDHTVHNRTTYDQIRGEALPASGTPIEQQLTPEVWLGPDWLSRDPRVSWLADFLAAHRERKILLICRRDQCARELDEHLRLRLGVRSALFHAGADLVARDRAAAYFAESEGGAQVLVCSEIGSEGRNFQFSHDLVLFDLPRSPAVLEQRIGRLDRIGQIRDVRIHVPVAQGSAAARLLRWYHQGLDAFEHPCAIGERMMEEFADRLDECLAADGHGEQAFETLLAETAARKNVLNAALSAGRDRLIEMNSCRSAKADEVIGEILDEQKAPELAGHLEQLMNHFGVEQEHNDANSVILKPGEHMLNHSLPGLPEDGMTGTFSRTEALQREDFHFLTWEHPLVQGAMDGLIDSGAGNTAFATAALKGLPPGTLLIEARFAAHCPARRALRVQRFFEAAALRFVCDEKGRDFSSALSETGLAQIIRSVPARNAHELVKHARARINGLVERAEALAAPRCTRLKEAAIGSARAVYDEEIARLQALAAVNPAVGSEEIAHLREDKAEVLAALDGLRLDLDAVRIVVVTPLN